MDISGHLDASFPLHPAEWAQGTNWIGGWASLRASPDVLYNSKYLAIAWNRIPIRRSPNSYYTD